MMMMLWWNAANGHTRSPQWKGYDSPKIRDHFSFSRTHDTESLESQEHGTLATTTQPKVEIQTNFWKSENGPLKKEIPCEQRWEITALSDSEAAFWFKTGLGSVLGYQEPVWVQTVGKAENCRHVEWLMVNDVLLSFHLSLYTYIHPWRLTWNISMEVWKIIFLSKWVICRFHVNLPGCIIWWWFNYFYCSPLLWEGFQFEIGSNHHLI